MYRVSPYLLWVGHSYEEKDLPRIYSHRIEAVVLLSLEAAPAVLPRDMIVGRFPIIDGVGNSRATLVAAVRMVATLVESSIPTLVCCGAGMSRSPAIVATALSRLYDGLPSVWLERVTAHHPSDISPGLWHDLNALPLDILSPKQA